MFQQLKALLLKRYRIFVNRYWLAMVILVVPALLEFLFTLIIPSETYLIENDTNFRFSDVYKLNANNYGKFHLLYQISDDFYSKVPLKSLLKNFYTPLNRPNIELVQSPNENISDYVLDKRKSSVRFLTDDYHMAMTLSIQSAQQFTSTIYYSSMAFHSSTNILHEMTNLYLSFLSANHPRSITTYTSSLYTKYDKPTFNLNFLKDLACLDVLPSSVANILNSVLIGFLTSIMVIHVSRERINGSKSQQLLAGTRAYIYWVSNYLFDLVLFIFELTLMIVALKLVDLARQDPSNEIHPLTSSENIGYMFMLFYLSAFSSCALTYVWSFLFKSEMIGFVVLAIILGVSSFLDMIAAFIQLFVQLDVQQRSPFIFKVMSVIRYIFLALCPNVTVKRGLYFLKIRDNKYCIRSVNQILNG